MNYQPIKIDGQPGLDEAVPISESSQPEDLILWALNRFSTQRLVLTTSFGMEGCALIDLFSRFTSDLVVSFIDTGFFFDETLKLKNEMQEKYTNFTFERWESYVSLEKQSSQYGDQLWESNPNLCCHLRKVVPMKTNLKRFDIWTTALRKTQTESRSSVPVLGWDWTYQVLKFCPFANWTRAQVWEYVQANQVPFNPLHLKNYPSIGCTHCTLPVAGSSPESDSREGRWKGTEKTECGLHYSI